MGKIFFPGCQERIKTVIALLSLASMKLLRVHMAAQGNATIILLVALLGIWLKCRSKIHTDKPKKTKTNKCTSHSYKWLRVWSAYIWQENINLFSLQNGSSAVVTTMQINVVFYNRFIQLTDGKLCSLSKHPKYVSVQHEMQHYEWYAKHF